MNLGPTAKPAPPVCRRCSQPIHGDLYRLRLILLDALPDETTDKTGEFHPGCAAGLSRAFDGANE